LYLWLCGQVDARHLLATINKIRAGYEIEQSNIIRYNVYRFVHIFIKE